MRRVVLAGKGRALLRATCSRHATSRGQRRQHTISPASSARASAEGSVTALLTRVPYPLRHDDQTRARDSSHEASAMSPNRRARLLAVPAALLAAQAWRRAGQRRCRRAASRGKRRQWQTISDFQTDADGGRPKKICRKTWRPQSRQSCRRPGATAKAALKSQLAEIDILELTVESVELSGNKASAAIKSTWSGKSRRSTIELTKKAAPGRSLGWPRPYQPVPKPPAGTGPNLQPAPQTSQPAPVGTSSRPPDLRATSGPAPSHGQDPLLNPSPPYWRS